MPIPKTWLPAEESSKFEQIYTEYRRLMFSVAYSVLQDKDEAEDAVQLAFMKIYKHMHKLRVVKSPETKAYIVETAEHEAIDILRKKRNRVTDDDVDEFGIVLELPMESDTANAMARLPAQYREILLLRYAQGYSTLEIGVMQGKTRSTVQRTLSRAKSALKEQLKKDGVRV